MRNLFLVVSLALSAGFFETNSVAEVLAEEKLDLSLGSLPERWRVEPGDWARKPGLQVIVDSDPDGEPYLRLVQGPDEKPTNVRIAYPMDLPPDRPAQLVIRCKFRVVELKPSSEISWAGAKFDVNFSDGTVAKIFEKKADVKEWESVEKSVPIPDTAQSVKIMPGLYVSSGQMDIRELEIKVETK